MEIATEIKMLQGMTIKKWEPLEVQAVALPRVGVPVQVEVPEVEILRTVQAAHRDTLVVVHRHVEGTVTPVHGAVAVSYTHLTLPTILRV